MIDYMPSVNHQQLGNINKHEHAVNMESSAPWSHLDFDPDKVMLTRSWCQCVAITVHFTFWNAFRPEERSAASVSQSVINMWQHRDAEMLSSACKMFNRNYRQQDGTHPKTHMKQTNKHTGKYVFKKWYKVPCPSGVSPRGLTSTWVASTFRNRS